MKIDFLPVGRENTGAFSTREYERSVAVRRARLLLLAIQKSEQRDQVGNLAARLEAHTRT